MKSIDSIPAALCDKKAWGVVKGLNEGRGPVAVLKDINLNLHKWYFITIIERL